MICRTDVFNYVMEQNLGQIEKIQKNQKNQIVNIMSKCHQTSISTKN
jgi:hypothetical protein